MTQNQIRYWEVQETKRANEARERETVRSNLAQERENYRHNTAVETETKRSNIAHEDYNNRNLLELSRHNVASEQLQDFSNRETQRHNRATEGISQQQVSLGYAQLAETVRNNNLNYRVGMLNASANQQNALTNARNASTNARNAETNRINAKTNIVSAAGEVAYNTARADNYNEMTLESRTLFPMKVVNAATDTTVNLMSAGSRIVGNNAGNLFSFSSQLTKALN